MNNILEISLELYPHNINEIYTFICNTILVINNARLCYKVDVFPLELRYFLIDCVLQSNQDVKINNDTEPLLFLYKNESVIINSNNICNILDYFYDGDDFSCESIDRYMVMPTVVINNQRIFLYSVMVPKNKMNNSIKDKISSTLDKFQKIFTHLNYQVTLTVINYPANGVPDFGTNITL